MNKPVITRTNTGGFEGFDVDTGRLSLRLVPAMGGKISSLRDVHTGREWLARHPRLVYKRVPHGSSYVENSDTGGWDECFPSVSGCEYPSDPWRGAAIQDHGELWSQPADFEFEEQAGSLVLRTRWKGVALPYTFTRAIHLAAGSPRLHVEYAVRNDSAQPLNFVWCIHALLAIEPGMQLQLPASARFHSNGTFPPDLLTDDSNLSYPFAMPGLNFPAMPAPTAARAIKIWSDPLPADAGWAAMRADDGQLRMEWDVSQLPQLAVWMNFGAWAGDGGAPLYNLGLEPCIGAQDSLAEAVTRQHLFASLPPHEVKTWWLDIELSA